MIPVTFAFGVVFPAMTPWCHGAAPVSTVARCDVRQFSASTDSVVGGGLTGGGLSCPPSQRSCLKERARIGFVAGVGAVAIAAVAVGEQCRHSALFGQSHTRNDVGASGRRRNPFAG